MEDDANHPRKAAFFCEAVHCIHIVSEALSKSAALREDVVTEILLQVRHQGQAVILQCADRSLRRLALRQKNLRFSQPDSDLLGRIPLSCRLCLLSTRTRNPSLKTGPGRKGQVSFMNRFSIQFNVKGIYCQAKLYSLQLFLCHL